MSLITYRTRVHFADNALEDVLVEEIARHTIKRPLVVTDDDAADKDELDRLFDALPSTVDPITFVLGHPPHSPHEHKRARQLLEAAHCDALIGFGGMHALDLARVVGDTHHPVITIPTRTESIGLGPIGSRISKTPGPRPAIPVAILCDATLTMGANPAETAATGMGALVRCLESFLGTTFNPPADGIALDGLRRATRHIEAAVCDGKNIVARRELLAAALDAELAAEKGYGGLEAAAKALAAATQARHRLAHGALLTEVLRFNAPAVSDRFALLRTTLGLSSGTDVAEQLALLAERIGLPGRLADIGVKSHQLPLAARRAAADPANQTNPRLATADDYERIMRAAF